MLNVPIYQNKLVKHKNNNIINAATLNINDIIDNTNKLNDSGTFKRKTFIRPEYVFNPSAINNWRFFHRPHQIEALKNIRIGYYNHISDDQNICYRGRIQLPCGTGKTRIQTDLHIQNMLEHKESKDGISCIASHRLGLNQQLLLEIVDVACRQSGFELNILFIGTKSCISEKWVGEDLYKVKSNFGHNLINSKNCEILATTKVADISFFIKKTLEQGRYLLVVSTYQSIIKLLGVKIDLLTCDEAHTTVIKNFNDDIRKITLDCNKALFFTATQKGDIEKSTNSKLSGMREIPLYGEILYDGSPKALRLAGELCSPRIQFVSTSIGEEVSSLNLTNTTKSLIDSFNKHDFWLKQWSCDNSLIGAKIIVVHNSIEELSNIYDGIKNPNFILYCKENNITTMAVSSKNNCCFVDGKVVNRSDFLEALNNLKHLGSQRAIIGNVDILIEGIDLPGITAVMPLRNLAKIKLVQLFGRSLRLHPEDRKKIYEGSLKPFTSMPKLESEMYSLGFVKPFGVIIIPSHLSTTREYDRMISDIEIIYNSDKSLMEHIFIREMCVSPDSENPEDHNPGNEYSHGKSENLEHRMINTEVLNMVLRINSAITDEEINVCINDAMKL